MNEYLAERDLWWPVSPELMDSYRDGSHTKKTSYGSLEWWKDGELHREDDKPAWIYADGALEWLKNGDWHRDGDKPAVIDADGSLRWYKNGLRHRDSDKPATICPDGTLVWYKNDKLHRVTGPAVINPNNKHRYWINGVNVTKEVKSWLKTRKYKAPFTPEQAVEFTLTFG
jgi:hypothetical protein